MPALLLLAVLALQDGGVLPSAPLPRMLSGTVSYYDYPEHSRRLEEEGAAGVAYTVDAAGRVSSCAVEASSGFPRLDEISCRVVRRFQYAVSPELAAWAGKPIYRKITWKLDNVKGRFDGAIRMPEPEPDPSHGINRAEAGELASGRRVNIALNLVVTPLGDVQSCKVRWRSDSKTLDRKACDMALKWKYRPAVKADKPVSYEQFETFFWAAADIPLADR